SAMRRDDRTDLQRGMVDLQEVMDCLAQKKGAARFILIGLCSGVDPVHGVSRGDPRVVGAVHIDGYTYPTSEFRLRHLTLRKLQTARWRRYARRLYTTKITKDIRVETGDAPEIFDRDYPPREQFRDDVNKMTSAGTRLLLVYTGTVDSAYNYERQAYDMLAPLTHRDNIEVALHERADHLYTSLTERRRLFVLLEGWMIRHFTL
ncbi:MAG TPA: hypothetical protein VFH51_14350, partial [Myxococcota bacterium]|nr:hypothetical protein [Myxococcota bacterium]